MLCCLYFLFSMKVLIAIRAKKLYAAGENLEETAEKELLAAASSIDQATQVNIIGSFFFSLKVY
jgi:hypothetical protein